MNQLSAEDLVQIRASYFWYMNAADEDDSALDGGDFQSLLQDIKRLLNHVQHLEGVIESRQVSLCL